MAVGYDELEIKVQNYKSFGDKIEGFESIKSINLIIGKNNTGKSALLDLVNFVVDYNQGFMDQRRRGNKPVVYMKKPLLEAEVENSFPRGQKFTSEPIDMFTYGMTIVGRPVEVKIDVNKKTFVSIEPDLKPIYSDRKADIARAYVNPLHGKLFRRILADRDIKPEGEGGISINADGSGATNCVQNIINQYNFQRSWVENDMLLALNEIFEPDATFKRIMVERTAENHWQILLEEEDKGSIALSDSGSGLKTIFLVLLNTILYPKYEGKSLDNYVFAFEELENNLHPSLERRLLRFLQKKAKEGAIFFLTTHSNVAIDVLSKDETAQIIHVKHDGKSASCSKVETHLEKKLIIDDLDIRASDLLQSNCIVWLEGPSDRVYFNRWVELWSNGQLKENVHYQCVFTGGSILSHYSASDDLSLSEIPLFRINTNSIVLMDSDKASRSTPLKKRVKSIKQEIEKIGGYAWITNGREVENYLPHQALKSFFPKKVVPNLSRYEPFYDFLGRFDKKGQAKFSNSKTAFAKAISDLITLDMIKEDDHLKRNIKKVCDAIKRWNQMK